MREEDLTSIRRVDLVCSDVQLDPAVKEAFDVAYDNIYAFHAAQRTPEQSVENMKVSAVILRWREPFPLCDLPSLNIFTLLMYDWV